MPRSYSDFNTLIVTKLADTAQTEFVASEVNYGIEEGLKEITDYIPHLLECVFKLESRYGTDITGTASALTDSVKSQFLSTDPTNEKVVHNVTDNTWAVITGYTSTSIVTLSADIMDANEDYRIYNKHCRNKRQIYIGDFYESTLIHSVEYPIGQKRNFKVLGDVIEIDVDYIPDSNMNVTDYPDVDVLVRFIRPHIVSQLTDWGGIVKTAALAGATSLAMSSLQSAGTIEEGEEFYIAGHRSTYVVTSDATIASNTVAISIYPALEAAAASATVTTFRKSSLTPQLEEITADLVAARLLINKTPKFINSISLGGGAVDTKYLNLGQDRLGETLSKLRRMTPPKTKRRYPTDD